MEEKEELCDVCQKRENCEFLAKIENFGTGKATYCEAFQPPE